MKKIILLIVITALAACSAPSANRGTYDLINAELTRSAEPKAEATPPEAVASALLPPLAIDMPQVRKPVEERFSLTFNNVPASQFFNAIVSGTRYNMLVHPEVSGTISANLKDVTLFEALDAIRELYGYDYQVNGNSIMIRPLTLQTKVFQVNYLTGNRRGNSTTTVTSGNDINSNNNNSNNNANNNNTNNNNSNANNNSSTGSNSGSRQSGSSSVNTITATDFWSELRASLEAIVGTGKEGRSVVISPQSGVVVIRAMPDELRNVSAYLKATQLSVDRQVILEAKILEVQLNDSYQSGINWAGFRLGGNTRVSAGLLAPGTSLASSSAVNALTANGVASAVGSTLSNSAAGSLFGLAFQTSNFSALISFLETQGTVHVLSSPRIATLNNQKAVLKVGTDEFFVTNVSTTTTAGTTTTTTPSVTLQSFFSGVVLDVTPQIDEQGNIILHIHPSVSQVSTVNKSINLGVGGSLTLPLAASSTSETDSVVRGQDGQIVAIGGLMRQATVEDRSGLPGASNTPIFGNTSRTVQKRELVILLKPTIVHGSSNWAQNIMESQQRIQGLAPKGTWE
ncbi:MAG TPA: secretin N-terminal domain-containing protein [Noviherbaspirillum sp.]|uniref:secretin N-terminal domain-containing protein n=1 Tax=Noviherbaspirillum sp. TaxID=1926288 RepID=UPI002D36E4AF|nr:secretin N-terminal domain-containing protein [Noviherbaspirillum sp.]HYD96059.1 secretin N-terminal domain-containing protein [Noviherbaspirillum sp.]